MAVQVPSRLFHFGWHSNQCQDPLASLAFQRAHSGAPTSRGDLGPRSVSNDLSAIFSLPLLKPAIPIQKFGAGRKISSDGLGEGSVFIRSRSIRIVSSSGIGRMKICGAGGHWWMICGLAQADRTNTMHNALDNWAVLVRLIDISGNGLLAGECGFSLAFKREQAQLLPRIGDVLLRSLQPLGLDPHRRGEPEGQRQAPVREQPQRRGHRKLSGKSPVRRTRASVSVRLIATGSLPVSSAHWCRNRMSCADS